MTKLILAYCIENQIVAAKIASALNGKATIEKVVFDYTVGMETLRKATYSSTAPVLLLISDNFLKSEKCMNDALPLIQSLGAAQRLISVTTEGVYQENGRPMILPTSFDRVSNVIQYMNHWQDRYLDLRRKKPEGDETAFNEKIRVVRTISSEIGELLRYLRSTEYYSFDQFEDSNFIGLYRVLGITGVAETVASSNIASKVSVSHTAFPTEMVAVEELEPANAMADEAMATASNGSYWGAKKGKSEAQSFLDSIMGEENAPKIEHEEIVSIAHVSNTEGVDKMKELASNGVVLMKETLIENGVNKATHLVEDIAENGLEKVAEKATDLTEVIDNQSPTSDFQIRANQLINEGLDRPTSLESLIAGMREEENYVPKTKISEDLSRQVDAILDDENPTVEATSFGGFTLEQILKDEELRVLMNVDAEAREEVLATEPIANGICADARTASQSSNGNGHHAVLTDDDTDLVKKIAAEAEFDFEEQMRLKIASETPTKVDNTPITAAEMLAETPTKAVEMVEPTAIEYFAEKTDAEFRDLLADTDEETVKSEVSRIFDEAEEPAAHFEFEEDINDKLDEKTAALFEEKTVAEPLKVTDNQLDSVEAKNTEGSKMETKVVQEFPIEPMNNPTDNAARYQLAAELAQQSRLTEATEQLEILLETDRKNVEAYVLLAYLAEQQNDYTLSLNSLEKVALLNPD